MIEASVLPILKVLALISLASIVSVYFSLSLPWQSAARKAGIPLAFGAAMAPFAVGILSTLSLFAFAGAPQTAHEFAVYISIALISVLFFVANGRLPLDRLRGHSLQLLSESCRWSNLTTILIGIWVASLLKDTLFLPLTQNDALEYLTVGRILFESPDIAQYPAVEPAKTASGFYGPWTHPPLYVALVFLFNCIQGTAEYPGVTRAIAPWFLISSTLLIVSMGRLHSLLTGLLAGLLFISTPLLYLGAASALIDSLPVAGATIVLATTLNLELSKFRYGVWNGLALGFALWTHSQAILLVAIWLGIQVLIGGDYKKRIHAVAISLAVATIIAAGPYLRNLVLYDSLISDNPVVFALRELNWPEYFAYARGYISFIDKIQYGLFKGWTMIEAYSFTFWLALVAFIFYASELRHKLGVSAGTFRQLVSRIQSEPQIGYLAFLVIYFIGVFVSILIGIDLMIRNERYLLIAIPAASIFASYGVTIGIGSFHQIPLKKYSRNFAMALIAIFSIAQIAAILGYKTRYNFTFAELVQSDRQKLQNWPAFAVANYLSLRTPKDSVVLSLKPADMYFSNRKMISYLDLRLVPFYKEMTAEAGFEALKSLGISYIHLPDYTLPPLYNSVLSQIVNSPAFTKLVYSIDGSKILKLVQDTNRTKQIRKIHEFGPRVQQWHRERFVILGGRKGLARFRYKREKLANSGVSDSRAPAGIFNREFTTILLSHDPKDKDSKRFLPTPADSELLLNLLISGQNTLASVNVIQVDQNGKHIYPIKEIPSRNRPSDLYRAGEILLNDDQTKKLFVARFKTYPNTSGIYIAIEHRGSSQIAVHSATLSQVNP